MKILIALVFPLVLLASAIAFAKDKPHSTPTRMACSSYFRAECALYTVDNTLVPTRTGQESKPPPGSSMKKRRTDRN